MEREKLATASAAGILGVISAIWFILAGVLFIGFGETFTRDLAPLLWNQSILAGVVNIGFAVMDIIGGYFVYTFKYRKGGLLILLASTISIIAGGGFYVATLWGCGAGVIALICPNLEERILSEKAKA